MSRPSRLGHQASQTFEKIPQAAAAIDPPAWLVLPLLVWSRWQLSCLEAMEESIKSLTGN
ncbi:hypothetical protein JST97_20385 [bacterium]|nr:hypothetical protein [bacterium]